MTVARRVRVSGHVQGVWFRAWTQQQALKLGVTGWVRNCDDGSVEAHVEGGQQSVALLIEQLRAGPSGARVDAMQSDDAAPEGISGFEVRP